MRDWIKIELLLLSGLFCFSSLVSSETDPNDFAILAEFQKGLVNPELLQWPPGGNDPCGPPRWNHVFCDGTRVTQIQVLGLNLSGPLPQDFNKLSELTNLGLQKNKFNGKLPSFSGLSKLQYAYLGDNQFDTIPSDFFVGLTSLQVLSLDQNPLNQSTGWMIPPELENSVQLMNLSLMTCNLIGPIPDYLGRMASLAHLKLAYNRLSDGIPASFSGSALQTLWLNNQKGPLLSGSIDIIASMTSLAYVWLHGNSFSGPIPDAIGACTSLKVLWLNNNQLVGLVPENLTTLPQLQELTLDNNKFMGPIPNVKLSIFSHDSNSFCQTTPGIPCSPEVSALLDLLGGMNYPSDLVASWSGNDPCNSWRGVACLNSKVSVINLPNLKLNGTISSSLGKLKDLVTVRLDNNNLTGTIPVGMTSLPSLKTLNLTDNNLAPPVPKFSSGVTLVTDGNPLLNSPGPPASPPANSPPSGNPPSPPSNTPSPPSSTPSNPSNTPSPPSNTPSNPSNTPPSTNGGGPKSRKFSPLVVVVPIVIGVLIMALVFLFVYFRQKGKNDDVVAPTSIIVHPRDPSDPDNMVKIAVANNPNTSITSSGGQSSGYTGTSETHVIEAGRIVISVQILRSVTNNFAPANELGRGGFGVVYKGELHDGTMIAVKRMVASVIYNKALDEFQAEIAVLSKVRHRNLVSLLGFSVEGSERLLVYEFMPQGALSRHLFQWKELNLEPLSWKKRLNIALDVARGMEYLHNLAHQSFIHRDLKPSNILIGDDFRAKVSDFGLVKLAPHGKDSVATRLAGTFGYLAPEYAVTGKVTTKADVFSFGVVLMELVTGLMALDEDRPEESRYLASWFYQIKSSKEKLIAAIDPSLDVTEETFESISIIAELAGHCAAREPQQRPDMGHAVNVLAPLVEKWKPMNHDQEEYMGIDLRQPLIQMVKGWQAADVSSSSLDDSKGSIPARPAGFAESFTSADGR